MVTKKDLKKKQEEVKARIAAEEKAKPKPTAPQINPNPIQPLNINQPQVIRDQETGEISGATINGKTYLGSTKEMQFLLEKAAGKRAAPAGTIEATDAQQLQEQNLLIPQRQELAARQQEELNQIDALKTNQEQLSTFDRNVQAGIAFNKSILENVGINTENSTIQPTGIERPLLAVIGVISTTNILGMSLSNLFSAASGNIKNLQGDVTDNVAESKRITTAATSRGANVQEAIQSLILLEESTRFKYNAAEKSLSESPKDVREGLDLLDEMSRNFRAIVENRQALERYSLTGDPKEVLLYLGNQEPTQ